MSRQQSPFRFARGGGRKPLTLGGLLLAVIIAILLGRTPYQHNIPPPKWDNSPPTETPSSEEVPPAPTAPGESFNATVAWVIDGDTVALADGRRVRYIGVDTPEKPRGNYDGECFWQEATQANKNWVMGRVVRLEPGVAPRDRYGRLLAYVWITDGGQEKMVNEMLLSGGFATPMAIAPNTRLQGRFEELTANARSASAGLWGQCATR